MIFDAKWQKGELSVGIDPAVDMFYSFDVCFRDIEHRKQIEQALQGICLLNPHGPHPNADVTVLGVDKGTAMGNAVEELKQQADYITTNILEDGVWNGLKHYHLI